MAGRNSQGGCASEMACGAEVENYADYSTWRKSSLPPLPPDRARLQSERDAGSGDHRPLADTAARRRGYASHLTGAGSADHSPPQTRCEGTMSWRKWGLPPLPDERYNPSAYGDLLPDQKLGYVEDVIQEAFPRISKAQGFSPAWQRWRRGPSIGENCHVPAHHLSLIPPLKPYHALPAAPSSVLPFPYLLLIAGTGNVRLFVGRRQSLSQMASAASTTWAFITFFQKRRNTAGSGDYGSIADRIARRQSPSLDGFWRCRPAGASGVTRRRRQPRLPPSPSVRGYGVKIRSGDGSGGLSPDPANSACSQIWHSGGTCHSTASINRRTLAGTWQEPGGNLAVIER